MNGITYWPLALKKGPPDGPTRQQLSVPLKLQPPDSRWWPQYDIPREIIKWPHRGPTIQQTFPIKLLERLDPRYLVSYPTAILTQWPHLGPTRLQTFPIKLQESRPWVWDNYPTAVLTKWPHLGPTNLQTFPISLLESKPYLQPPYPPADLKGFLHPSAVAAAQTYPALLETKPYLWPLYPIATLAQWPHTGPINNTIGSEWTVLSAPDLRWRPQRDIPRDVIQWQHIGATNLQTFPISLLETKPYIQPPYPVADLKGFLHPVTVTAPQTYPALLETKPYIWPTYPVPRELTQWTHLGPTRLQTFPPILLETKPYVWPLYPVAAKVGWPHYGPLNNTISSQYGPLANPDARWFIPRGVPRELVKWAHRGTTSLQTFPIPLLETKPFTWAQYPRADIITVIIPPPIVPGTIPYQYIRKGLNRLAN